LKKLVATIALVTFIFTSPFISPAFAANDASPGSAATPAYEIRKVEPAAPETQGTAPSQAEVIASSEATNAYISGVRPKLIEGAIFVTALIVMTVAIAGSGGDDGGSGHGQ
jgi:hypothetical protein